MAKSGHTPDCVHCRFMVRQKSGEYRCRQHEIILHTPVSMFCKNLTQSDENDDEAYQAWFDAALIAPELQANTLYTWVIRNTSGTQNETASHADAVAIAPINTYINWSAGAFWRVLRKVRQTKPDE